MHRYRNFAALWRSVLLAHIAALVVAPTALADWTIYGSGYMGIGSGTLDVQGTSDILFAQDDTQPIVVINQEGSDSTPAIGMSVGIQTPLDELIPWNLPFEWRPPTWKSRVELEFSGVRQVELVSTGFVNPDTGVPLNVAQNMFTEVSSWNMLFNMWQDVPMRLLDRPISKLFGRTPRRVSKALDRTDFHLGGGVGFASIGFNSTDNTHYAVGDTISFSWQVGGGFSYQLTPVVAIEGAYRYLDSGTGKGIFQEGTNNVPTDRGPYSVGLTSHEGRLSIRVLLYSFLNPWRNI